VDFLWTIILIYYLLGAAVMVLIHTRKSYIDRLIWVAEKKGIKVSDFSIDIGILIGSFLCAFVWFFCLIKKIQQGKQYNLTAKQEKIYRKDRGDKAII